MEIKNNIRQIYYFSKNIKYVFYRNNVHKLKKNSIILVTHDFERMGAELLLLYMAKFYYEKNIPLLIISRKDGSMISEFKKYGYVKVINDSKKIYKFLERNANYKYRGAIINTIINGDLIDVFNCLNIKAVITVHELDYVIKQANSVEKAIKVANCADIIVFPSEFVKNRFLNICKIKTNNVICMHQGLFLTKDYEVNKKMSRRNIIAQNPSINNNDMIVLNVATAGYRKGIDIFIDLAIKSFQNNDHIKYIWIGDKTSKHVQSKKKEYGLDNIPNLICPGYIKNKKEINDYYCGSDVFCLTSREEPFGSVVLEAMNGRLPVIAFKNSGGYLDVVKDNITGLLCEKNINDMYSKIIELQDKEKRILMGENGHLEAISFTFDDYCNKFLELLRYKK